MKHIKFKKKKVKPILSQNKDTTGPLFIYRTVGCYGISARFQYRCRRRSDVRDPSVLNIE